jgi:sigma-B regulation protein RsbU (phosphoserine phosphatase)
MQRLESGSVFGGIRNQQTSLQSNALNAALYTSSCEGGRGGDIHFFSVCRQDAITRVAIADVMGHGQQVADVAQLVYEALRDHMNDFDGHAVLEQANRVAAQLGIQAMTTAALLGVYTGDRTLRFSYAGHHPALHRAAGQARWLPVHPDEETPADNLPLAIAPQTTYDQHHHPLEPGDQLLLYTDGVLEARSPDGRELGFDHLTSTLNSLPATSTINDAQQAVLRVVENHVNGPLDQDDITIIALEVRPKTLDDAPV